MLFVDDFQFFDPEAEFTITAGDLPHWQQPGATYFITYRTIDSISAIAMERIIAERNDWLKRNGIDPALSGWHVMLRQCFSWKHFQAHAINLAESRQGHFFQPESFDHLVRDAEHLEKFRKYIEENPKKANLREGEFQLYLPDISLASRSAR